MTWITVQTRLEESSVALRPSCARGEVSAMTEIVFGGQHPGGFLSQLA
jgi:hypothetical protein